MKNQQNTSHHTWFDSLVNEYLDAQRPGHRPATLALWQRALGELQQFLAAQGRERLQDITGDDLEAWRGEMQQRFASATLEIFGRAARQFFTWLERQQRLFLNPARDFVVPKSERAALPVPTPEQIQKLLSQPDAENVFGIRDRALLHTTYATGMLVHELRGLHGPDVSKDIAQVRGRRGRKVPLTPEASQWLQRYLQEARPKLAKHSSPALWLNKQGEPLTREALLQIFRRHALDAGLGQVSPNALRRACATHRWQSGAHPLELQLLLGHRSLETLGQFLRVGVRELARRAQPQEAL
jgi:integrase/recombinase XerD